jgi:hypothetical protein
MACRKQTWRGVAGIGSFFCSECESTLVCSFCKKPRPEVPELFLGPGVYICSGCVDICQQILLEHHGTAALPGARIQQAPRRWLRRMFSK